MALEGTLRDFSFADILQLISLQRKTGVLTLKHEDKLVTISFLDGCTGCPATGRRGRTIADEAAFLYDCPSSPTTAGGRGTADAPAWTVAAHKR